MRPGQLCPCCGQTLRSDGDLRIDGGFIVKGGVVAILTAQEQCLFEALYAAQGKVVTKEQLLTQLYPIEADEAEIKIIDVFVCKVRKKLKPLGLTIQTEWGRGYRFVPAQRSAA